jgi:hypothetical protein
MNYWIGVATKDHVMVGVAGGFCQLGHGKHAPVKRLSPADWLIYYAPHHVKAFVAVGQVQPGEPYQQGDNFSPWRRDVRYLDAVDAPIHPLLDSLSFVTDTRHWGILFRRSLFEIPQDDFALITRAMQVEE